MNVFKDKEETFLKRYMVKMGQMNVHVTEWGDEDLPVIFCFHGLGATSLSFIEVAELLKEEYRIISIDAPGHGKTSIFFSSEEYEMPIIAEWLNQLITLLNIEGFYFLSHSWGSFVALYYLAKYPEKVKSSILIDGGYQGKKYLEQTVEEEVASYEIGFEEHVTTWDEFLDVVRGNSDRVSPYLEIIAQDLVLKRENKYFWHARGVTGGNIIKAMHKHETEDIYHLLPASITLLRATVPERLNEYRGKMAKLFKEKAKGIVKLIPNATHMIHYDTPDVVVEEIRKQWK
jgi:pimeloyl-ACP methyl ester carboxylesterase